MEELERPGFFDPPTTTDFVGIRKIVFEVLVRWSVVYA
jgi:hypothetical protein